MSKNCEQITTGIGTWWWDLSAETVDHVAAGGFESLVMEMPIHRFLLEQLIRTASTLAA